MGGEVRVRVIGEFGVDGFGEHDLGSRKARRLLKVLAAAGGEPVSVDRLADALWPEALPKHPSEQVTVLVSRLRGVLGADRLVRGDGGYRLAADHLDADELAARTVEATNAFAGGRLAAARAAADAALRLARGPVLPGEDGDWVEPLRAAVDAHVAAARRIATDAALAQGDHAAAVTHAELALAADPYDEHALRALMRSHAVAGSPASALAAYARTRRRLVEDLGVSPTADTERLHAELLAAEPASPPPATPPAAGSVVPTGRHEAWGELERWLAAGAGRPLVVEGEPGIGKTVLATAWAGAPATTERWLTIVARCDPLGHDLALQPIADAVDRRLRTAGDAVLDALGDDDRAVLATVLDIGPVPPGATATTVADPASMTRTFGALARCLAALAAPRQVLLVVEDLHHADRSTLAWLAHLTRRGRRIRVMATRRTGGPTLPDEHVVTLGPLDVDAVAELAGAADAVALHERTGGHPLLLAALLAARDVPGGTGTLGAGSTLREAVDHQLDALGDGAASVRLASVLGPDIDLDLLAACAGRAAVDVLGELEAAVCTGTVVDSGRGFAFRHELVREAVLAGVAGPRRTFAHRQAARLLSLRPAADPLVVAHHARLGGDDELAAASLVDAAARAERRVDLERAEELLGEALALRPSSDAFRARARVRIGRLDLERAADDAEHAVRDASAASAEIAGWVAYYRRRHDEARRWAEWGIETADDPAVRASCLALAGRVRHGAGDLAGALALLDTTEDAPPTVRPLGDVWRAHALVHAGRPSDALRLAERALASPHPALHPFAPLHGRFVRTIALGHLARLGDALAAWDELTEAAARGGDPGRRFQPIAANLRSWLLRNVGLVEAADEASQQALALTGGPTTEASAAAQSEASWAATLDLADARLLVDDLDGAAAIVERLQPLTAWRGTMARHQRHRLGLVRARLALADGDRTRAAELATAVADDTAACGAGRYRTLAMAVAGLAGEGTRSALDAVVDDLASAGLEGWRLAAGLAAGHGVEQWRRRAEQLAARVVAGAGPLAATAEAHVRRTLG